MTRHLTSKENEIQMKEYVLHNVNDLRYESVPTPDIKLCMLKQAIIWISIHLMGKL